MSDEEAAEGAALESLAAEEAIPGPSIVGLTRVLGALLLALLLTCWPLFNARSFPHLGLVSAPDVVHATLAATLALLAVLLLTGAGQRALLLGTAGVLLASVLVDELRLQPWAYEIFILLVLFAVAPRGQALAGSRLYLVGLYIWAGLHKANSEFIDRVVPWFAEPFDVELSASSALVLGLMVIVFETGSGIALLLAPLRRTAVVLLIGTHLVILVILGPWGHDWDINVWPWNLAQALLVWMLFWDWRGSGQALFAQAPRWLLVLALVLPGLHLFSWWPANLSHAVYAGNFAQPGFLVQPDRAPSVMRGGQRAFLAPGLPPPLREVLSKVGGPSAAQPWALMRVHDWAVTDLGATIPPDDQVARRLFKAFCARAKDARDLLLILRPKRRLFHGKDDVIVSGCDGKERGRVPLPESWPR